MAENTAIEWADSTFNPWIGCTRVGPGCDHCYAEQMMGGKDEAKVEGEGRRLRRVTWGADRSRTGVDTWRNPLKWERAAAAFFAEHGRRRRVFCASLADVFDNHPSILPAWRADLARLILATPSLDWLLLTKRIGNVPVILAEMFPVHTPVNVRIGATLVNQEEVKRDLHKIRRAVGYTRTTAFVSGEPLLGALDFAAVDPAWHRYIGWVIVGGESGKGARPMNPLWVEEILEQCRVRQVPFLFKQWGEFLPDRIERSDPRSLQHPVGHVIYNRVGKKAAGRKLYGVHHNGFPA
jgi:protein gp37